MLERYCAVHGIGYRRCGKLIVTGAAQEAEPAAHAALATLAANARACGVELEWLEGEEARRLEPELQCALALHSPATGIVDSHGLLQCLQGDAESYGANVAFGTRVTALRPAKEGIEVHVDFEARASLRARWIVNCAGVWAAEVAASMTDFPPASIPTMHLAKGSYFSLPGRAPFSRLIYPLPAADGHLGVHLTLDLGGSARFGPDMEWVKAGGHAGSGGTCASSDYAVDARRVRDFVPAIRAYWPGVPAERLVPAYAGIRAKLSGAGEASRDFLISGPADHGVPGVLNLFGIDSPGLTSCLALGDGVAALVEG